MLLLSASKPFKTPPVSIEEEPSLTLTASRDLVLNSLEAIKHADFRETKLIKASSLVAAVGSGLIPDVLTVTV